MATESVEQQASQEYQIKYQRVKGLFMEGDQRVFNRPSETLILQLNPGFLRPKYQGEIIQLTHIVNFSAGEKAVEFRDITILSPVDVQDNIPNLQTNFGLRRHYQGNSLGADRSNGTLRGIVAARVFALVDEFLNGSAKSSVTTS